MIRIIIITVIIMVTTVMNNGSNINNVNYDMVAAEGSYGLPCHDKDKCNNDKNNITI